MNASEAERKNMERQLRRGDKRNAELAAQLDEERRGVEQAKEQVGSSLLLYAI